MLKDEFKPIPRKLLTFGRSPKEIVIAIPKAIFELPPEEKVRALKELEEDMAKYQSQVKGVSKCDKGRH